nr:hypothetical protein [Pseudomonadota bacterium]
EYEFPKKWVAGTVMLLEKDKVETIGGISAYALPDSLENLNKFRLSGKPMTSYVMLALTCIVPVFVLYVLVLCAKTPIPKRKWLWVLFVLLGFVTFQLNWTDGSLRVVPLSFQLFAAGVSSPGPYSPTILSLSIPLGAIVFLLRRKKLTASEPL